MLKLMAAAPLLPSVASATPSARERRYHLCLASKEIARAPELLSIVKRAGVTDIWQGAFFYGHWYEDPEGLVKARKVVEDAGFHWHVINVPLGHPGDALGDQTGATPTAPPGAWKNARRPDGTWYSGTSLHAPATAENVAALRALAPLNPDIVFLDDDFRLATGPGVIGGCFCDEHKARFLSLHGYTEARWEELLDDVRQRRMTPLLRAWTSFTCDELTGSFHAQQAAIPGVALGNMIMYLGAEKAGIRLKDYRDAPFRVGELMFNDDSFGSVKARCDELFSSLFHRRFAQRELSYSETTAYPHDQLSGKNLAAKLAVSTLSDVPNTMFMSGVTPYPADRWEVLGPAMKEQARLHARIADQRPRGPLKHWWGEAARHVGNDKPYSLFLAMGVPFEVAHEPPREGHVFLCDDDARHMPPRSEGAAQWIARPEIPGAPDYLRHLPEVLESLWALKREIVSGDWRFPYVKEDLPIVCAWYPGSNAVVLWNLQETEVQASVQLERREAKLTLAPLGTAYVGLSE
jgi:hypothetical protein